MGCALSLERPLLLPADVTKHAVLGKFNEIRPGVYREYMKDVCEAVRTLWHLPGACLVPARAVSLAAICAPLSCGATNGYSELYASQFDVPHEQQTDGAIPASTDIDGHIAYSS